MAPVWGIEGVLPRFGLPAEGAAFRRLLGGRINETWLRTGEGEMHLPVNRDQAITDFMEDTLKGSPDFRTKLVGVLARLSVDEWDMLEHRARDLADATHLS